MASVSEQLAFDEAYDAIRRAFTGVLREAGDNAPPRFRELRIETDLRLCCARMRFDFEDAPPHFLELPHARALDTIAIRHLSSRASAVWADLYVRHYLDELLRGVRMALSAAFPPNFNGMLHACDVFEHRVLECRGIPLHSSRERSPVYQQIMFSPAVAAETAVTQIASTRPRMVEWGERFLDQVIRINNGTFGSLNLDVTQRLMQRLTEAPMVQEVRERIEPLIVATHDWVRMDYRYGRQVLRPGGVVYVGELTTEERAERERVIASYQAERAEAESRAEQLLRENLTSQQLAEFNKDKTFTVIGSQSGARYQLTWQRQMGIYKLDNDGHRVEKLCFLPRGEGGLAVGDVVLAQKIMLETDEPKARKIANKWPVDFTGRFVHVGGILSYVTDWL